MFTKMSFHVEMLDLPKCIVMLKCQVTWRHPKLMYRVVLSSGLPTLVRPGVRIRQLRGAEVRRLALSVQWPK